MMCYSVSVLVSNNKEALYHFIMIYKVSVNTNCWSLVIFPQVVSHHMVIVCLE